MLTPGLRQGGEGRGGPGQAGLCSRPTEHVFQSTTFGPSWSLAVQKGLRWGFIRNINPAVVKAPPAKALLGSPGPWQKPAGRGCNREQPVYKAVCAVFPHGTEKRRKGHVTT